MSGRPGTASGARGGGRPTTTPLNPFGLDGGGRASDADARDPLADSLARAESLLGRYAGDGGGTARPGTARPGTARPGTARPGTARRDPPTGSIVPPAARHAQPEVLVFDSARDASDSFARDVSASLDDDDASVSFPADDSSHPEIYDERSERSDRSELSDGDGRGLGSDRDVDEDDDDRAAAAASFSVDVDEDVDDASVSFGGAAFVVDEDSFGGDVIDDVDDRPSSPPRSWGDVASARPGTAKGAPRPASAPRSDPAFAKRAFSMGSTIRRGQGGLGSSLSASSAAPPWAGAFDGSALETTAEADESAEMLYDAEEDFAAEALEETSAAIEVASDDDDELDAEIVGDGDGDGDEDDAFPAGDRPRSSPAGSRSKSPAQLDAEAETEALHGRLRKMAPPSIAVASPPASPKRSSPAPRSPRFSGSPAALEAEADTDELHRTLSGNDPTAALKMEIAKKLRSPETLPPPPPPPAELPPVSPRGGARYPFAPANAMRVLNAGDDSSSADEVATEGEPTPRASARPQERLEERHVPTDIPDRAVAVARASPARSTSPRESRSPRSPRGFFAAGPSEEESFLLEAIRAARRGAPLDARASAMLAGLVPAPEREAETNVASAGGRQKSSAAEDVFVEAARDARRAFEYVATESLSGETPSGVSGRSPFFSPGAAAAEARALARDDARKQTEEAALASASVGATGRDDWWAFLGGSGGYPGATRRDLAAKRNETETETSISIGDDATSPELAWAHVLRARSFDGAMRARVASLRVRLRTCVAKAETSRFKHDGALGSRSSGSATATAR